MRKMKKMRCLQFLMMVLWQSKASERSFNRKMSPSMSSPKQSSSRNQSTSHMVPGSCSGKKKKQKKKETTQQNNSTEVLINTSKS